MQKPAMAYSRGTRRACRSLTGTIGERETVRKLHSCIFSFAVLSNRAISVRALGNSIVDAVSSRQVRTFAAFVLI